jgi:transcriptional regulator with XRE-family HTH domain
MQTIGERLEEARKRKGISIREASEATKIRSEYLHKFESNSLDINLPEIYIRGFLRNYAVYLKLNGDKLIADYKAMSPTEGKSSRRGENREVYGRVDLAATSRQNPAEPAPAADDSGAPTAAPAPTKPRSSAFPASAGTNETPVDVGLLIKGGVILLAIILLILVIFGIRALTSGPDKPATEVKSGAQQTLLLTATGPVEVQVREDTADGPIIWRGQMEAGDSRSLPKHGKLYLTATAIENLQIEINGKRAPNPHSGKLTVQIP